MPTYRKITGNLRGIGNSPFANSSIKVEHLKRNDADGVTFPKESKTYYTDENGLVEFTVWCNEEGESPSEYRITFPDGSFFDCVVPVGTEDLELTLLEDLGVSPKNPMYKSLVTYVLGKVGEAGAIADFYVAGETLSALRVVRFDPVSGKVFYASSSSLNDMFKIVGVTATAANFNENVKVITAGYLTDQSWNWSLDKPIFFGANGQLTQTPGSEFIQAIAMPMKSDRILVSIESPIRID